MSTDKKYKLLKDLPFLKAGTISSVNDGNVLMFSEYTTGIKTPITYCFTPDDIKANPDFFELVAEPSMPEIKFFNTVEAYNEGFAMGVNHCKKYGIPEQPEAKDKPFVWTDELVIDIMKDMQTNSAQRVSDYKHYLKKFKEMKKFHSKPYDARQTVEHTDLQSPTNLQESKDVVSGKERSKLYGDILSIVKKLKLEKTNGDSYDHPSISYELEQYFLNQLPQPSTTVKGKQEWKICAIRNKEGILWYTDMMPKKGETIEAVERISDNTVFSIGDSYDGGYKITSFKVDNGVMMYECNGNSCFYNIAGLRVPDSQKSIKLNH